MIRVLLAEDQLMFRTAVRRLLELESDIRVVAEVDRGDEVVVTALAARPDVAHGTRIGAGVGLSTWMVSVSGSSQWSRRRSTSR